jgi:starvation-inducible DNA-binding protein
MKTNIGITSTETIVRFLNRLLANEFILSTKAKNAHWNVTGYDFYEKHKFFETIINQQDEIIDDIAERIRILNIKVIVSLSDFVDLATLKDEQLPSANSIELINDLLADSEHIILELRKQIPTIAEKHKDFGTTDFLTNVLEKHEKMAWFLKSHLV